MTKSVEHYNSEYTDLLSERVGGKALACSDEWFAECENLVKHADPIFREGHFVATGQWMDGWESRRSFGRRERTASGRDHDWCLLRLGVPGVIHAVDIETTHFRGNAPEFASIEAACVSGNPDTDTQWFELLAKSPTDAHSHNVFTVNCDQTVTHLRLKMYPDGGVARLRAWGEVKPDPAHFVDGELIDLASVLVGGRGQQCSDRFYSSPSNLLMPYPGINMGDGWETKRRRDEANDWCVIKLGLPGSIRKVIVDTAHFKGNYPDRFSLEAVRLNAGEVIDDNTSWQTIIAPQPLEADQTHLFIKEIASSEVEQFSHVRLNIFPDGGVSRLRVIGSPNWNCAK
jgi:allantoicase